MGIVKAWAELNGFGILCDCGATTFIDTLGDGQTPTPMEFIVTCRQCGSLYPFKILPGEDEHG